MKMTKYAQAIKNELAMELAKSGSSLEQFEETLKSINTGEGVLKFAEESQGIIRKSLNFLPDVAVKGTLGGGALAGLTFDEMDKSVEGLNKSLDREREKINLVRRLTQNLQREHGLI